MFFSQEFLYKIAPGAFIAGMGTGLALATDDFTMQLTAWTIVAISLFIVAIFFMQQYFCMRKTKRELLKMKNESAEYLACHKKQ